MNAPQSYSTFPGRLSTLRSSIQKQGVTLQDQDSAMKMTKTLTSFDKIDFSKPERFMGEIYKFLSNVTLVFDYNSKQRYRSLSSNEAQQIL